MTLSTDIVVVDPVPIDELFAECQRLLGANDRHEIRDEPLRTWNGEDFIEDLGARRRSHSPGIGLPALLDVEYSVEAPMPTRLAREQQKRDQATYGEDSGFDGPRYENHFAKVNFDTAYGYNNGRGGCSDLHAWLVSELGRWLDDRGRRYRWQNEFTGDWYDSGAQSDKLGDADLGALR